MQLVEQNISFSTSILGTEINGMLITQLQMSSKMEFHIPHANAL